jgi:uncharacterized protein (DUF305 family)
MRKSLIGIVAIAGFALAACGGNDMAGMSPGSSSTAQAAGHNADDVAFAQGMVPHHAQAIDMAKMVPTRSTNPKLLDLAKKVEAAQDPEIKTMNEWLAAWGATTSMPGMNHGSAADMDKLEQAKGAEFDTLWLDLMIKHHEGAIDMAKTELAKGSNVDAKKLAQEIIDAQQKEITEMQGLLKA